MVLIPTHEGATARVPKGFGGKKAAPFTKGGKRKQSHPHTAKGTQRQKGKK